MNKSSKSFIAKAFAVALAASPLLFASACSTMTSSHSLYPGVPGAPFPPTDPMTVKILRNEPTKPHIRLGEIVIDPTGGPDLASIEQRFREETARLGGSAVDPDVDHDGLENSREIALGTDPFNPDTDGDGVPDGADGFPLDPTQSVALPIPADHTPPSINLTEPAEARALP